MTNAPAMITSASLDFPEPCAEGWPGGTGLHLIGSRKAARINLAAREQPLSGYRRDYSRFGSGGVAHVGVMA